MALKTTDEQVVELRADIAVLLKYFVMIAEIRDVNSQKNITVRSQKFEDACALRDKEKKLEEELKGVETEIAEVAKRYSRVYRPEAIAQETHG